MASFIWLSIPSLVGSVSFFIRSVNIPRLVGSASFLVCSVGILTLVVGLGSMKPSEWVDGELHLFKKKSSFSLL